MWLLAPVLWTPSSYVYSNLSKMAEIDWRMFGFPISRRILSGVGAALTTAALSSITQAVASGGQNIIINIGITNSQTHAENVFM